MATKIYLGNTHQYVIDWIKAHSKPVANPKTKITFTDGSVEEYDWSGEITKQTMIDAYLYDTNYSSWIKGQGPQIVEIGTQVTRIGINAFNQCMSLTNVMIPNSVMSIGDHAFSNCKLKSITIPDSVTSIEDYAFENGIHASVVIGNGVTSIGQMAFSSCYDLTDVTFSGKDKATVKNMANYYWALNRGNCVIHCTDGDITL